MSTDEESLRAVARTAHRAGTPWALDPVAVGAGAFDEFVAEVVPELQGRGLFRTAYEGTTLRQHLGLRRPERGEWKARRK
ncbi:hypothetical protein ACQP2X_23355 [Actinoplanes sp. CA-131856]